MNNYATLSQNIPTKSCAIITRIYERSGLVITFLGKEDLQQIIQEAPAGERRRNAPIIARNQASLLGLVKLALYAGDGQARALREHFRGKAFRKT